MVLESTIICVDSSDYMRNGDFLPTRLLAQQDAVYLLSKSKLRLNAENKVGLLALVNHQVLINLTSDIACIYSKLHQLQPKGLINFFAGIKTAHLALKHREGKNHKTKVIAFVGSPVDTDKNQIIQLAKLLKKEKVYVDIVSFGEDHINNDILNAFISTLNGKDGTNNHLVSVAEGIDLTDALISSPIIERRAAAEAAMGRSNSSFGFDPSDDPELAMALLLSMQEEESRIGRIEATTTQEPDGASDLKSDDDQNQLRSNVDFSELSELQQLLFALQMSMHTDSDSDFETDEAFFELINDPDFLENVVDNWPVLDDSQTSAIQEAIKKLKDKRKSEYEDKTEDKN